MNNWLERYHRSSWPVILMTSAYAAAVGVLYRGLQAHDPVNIALLVWVSSIHLFNGASLCLRGDPVGPDTPAETDEPPR